MTIVTHDSRRCRAHNRAGDPCSAYAIRGAVVCVVHGGAAPQVKRAAEERLREMVDPALNRLEALLDDDSSAVALAAVKDVLDRAGYKPKERVESVSVGAFTLRIDRGDSDT